MLTKPIVGGIKKGDKVSKTSTSTDLGQGNMAYQHPNYQTARRQLVSFLRTEGFQVHPDEVYCPSLEHCWVDVAALKGQDYWAFEYKSRKDSIKRGLEQCRSYSRAFNYVVLVADRHRTTASPYFGNFKRNGFGIWSHAEKGFNPLLRPQRRIVERRSRAVVERQFARLKRHLNLNADRKISEWFPTFATEPRISAVLSAFPQSIVPLRNDFGSFRQVRHCGVRSVQVG